MIAESVKVNKFCLRLNFYSISNKLNLFYIYGEMFSYVERNIVANSFSAETNENGNSF